MMCVFVCMCVCVCPSQMLQLYVAFGNMQMHINHNASLRLLLQFNRSCACIHVNFPLSFLYSLHFCSKFFIFYKVYSVQSSCCMGFYFRLAFISIPSAPLEKTLCFFICKLLSLHDSLQDSFLLLLNHFNLSLVFVCLINH